MEEEEEGEHTELEAPSPSLCLSEDPEVAAGFVAEPGSAVISIVAVRYAVALAIAIANV